MFESKIEAPRFAKAQLTTFRYGFSRTCQALLVALFTATAIDSAQAAEELTATDKFETLIESGIFSGTSDSWSEDEKMTREDVAQKLIVLLESDPGTETPSYKFLTEQPGGPESPILSAALVDGIGEDAYFDIDDSDVSALLGWLDSMYGTTLSNGFTGLDSMDEATMEHLAALLPSLWNELQRQNHLNDASDANTNDPDTDEFPYVTAGVVTPPSSWPTALNATYNGRITGALTDSTPVTGSLTMNVDFAQINSMDPNIPGSIVFDNGKGSANFTLVQMGGYVGNSMSGTYNGEAMTGFMKDGQFYGPAANEIGGKWDMTTNSVSGSGTYAAKR